METCSSAAHPADRLDERMTFGFGEAARDLVEKQDFRIGSDRARKLEPFALQEAKRASRLIGAGREPGFDENAGAAGPATSASRFFDPKAPATSRFSNTVSFSNGCGI